MKEIKNVQGKVIGRVSESGTQSDLYSATGVRLGRYDSKTGETKNVQGKVVSRGPSTLTSFLK